MDSKELSEFSHWAQGWISSTPRQIQWVVQPLFNPFLEVIEMVTGHPDALFRAAGEWQRAANGVEGVARRQQNDGNQLGARWHGPAYQAFRARSDSYAEALHQVGKNFRDTSSVLDGIARDFIETTETIVDITAYVVMFLICDVLVNGILRFAGGFLSLLITAAEIAARALREFVKITKIANKLVNSLDRAHNALQKLHMGVGLYRYGLNVLDELANEAPMVSIKTMWVNGVRALWTLPIRGPVSWVLGEWLSNSRPVLIGGIAMEIGRYFQITPWIPESDAD